MSRVKRSAAALAEDKIRQVLDWEELSEHSAKFKEVAARIDDEFAAEQRSKRVKERDLDTVENVVGDNEEDADDEVPTAEDLAFIEPDEAYQSTDEEYHTAASDVGHSSGEESMSENAEDSDEGSGNDSEDEIEPEAEPEAEHEAEPEAEHEAEHAA